MRIFIFILLFTCSLFFSVFATSEDLSIGGFSETVIIVTDLEATTEFFQKVAGWQVFEKNQEQKHIQKQANEKLKNLIEG